MNVVSMNVRKEGKLCLRKNNCILDESFFNQLVKDAIDEWIKSNPDKLVDYCNSTKLGRGANDTSVICFNRLVK